MWQIASFMAHGFLDLNPLYDLWSVFVSSCIIFILHEYSKTKCCESMTSFRFKQFILIRYVDSLLVFRHALLPANVLQIIPGKAVFPDYFHPNATVYWTAQARIYFNMVQFDGVMLVSILLQMSRLVGKPTMWFPNRFDINQPVQAQRRARSLKFWI